MIKIEYNGHLSIATAFSRHSNTWHNSDMLWGNFLEKIESTQRTRETVKQYRGLPKEQQDSIKDVGGFFGGYLSNGKRSNSTILSRQLITLDIDEGVKDLWEVFTMMYGCSAALYTTHKHTPRNPRYRLMVPLKEEVTADEYEAIARKIASDIGIDYFDDTTFQPARFMYWPSTSSDGEYIFEYQDGSWLGGKELLTSAYKDWKDRSEWPYSSRVPKVVKVATKKQGEPTEKPGLVGLFCRAYNIYDAIDTFLSDVYSASEDKDRYTFVNGTTSNGLVIYEGGKFAFSNHSTDPAGGHLCNSFDLVRLHLYGERDDKERTYQKPSDMPSFALMEELCSKDANVAKMRASEKIAEVNAEFSDLDMSEDDTEAMSTLLESLDADKKGNYLPTLKNYQAIIENDPKLKGKIAFDEFARQVFVKGELPWRTPANYYDAFWTNADDSNLRCYLNAEPYALKASIQNVQDAFDAVMCRHSFHPIREYLKGLEWDGTERLDSLYIDYFGALDTPLNRAMTRKSFVAAVARVFQPGCKWDYVLTIIGSEGLGKSSLLAKMGGVWFSDSFNSIDGTKGMEQLQRVWILELGELSVYKKAEVEPMKAFITKRVDQFRPAYGRKTEIYPRQCTFFATTNENNFLKGDTGNRRFWPLATGLQLPTKAIKDLDDEERDQLWAEAKYRYDKGELLYLPKTLESEAHKLQTEHGEEDERLGIIQEFVDRRIPPNWERKNRDERREYFNTYNEGISATGIYQRDRITAIEVLCECFGERIDDSLRYRTRPINSILKKLDGWKCIGVQRTSEYGAQRTFERIKKENNNDLNI